MEMHDSFLYQRCEQRGLDKGQTLGVTFALATPSFDEKIHMSYRKTQRCWVSKTYPVRGTRIAALGGAHSVAKWYRVLLQLHVCDS